MTETQLIQGCKDLEVKFQRALVAQYSGILYSVARRYCGDGALAKDALQEGLIRIFKNIDKFRADGGNFQGWMKRIVANEALRVISKELKVSSQNIDDVPGIEISPSAIDRLHEEELLRLIQGLPLGYREVFNMYIIEGYDHKEIGQLLGIEASSSRAKLSRAKKMLQQKISMIENLQICHKAN